jgi:hypothetical protein
VIVVVVMMMMMMMTGSGAKTDCVRVLLELLDPVYKGTTFFRNVGNFSLKDTASQPIKVNLLPSVLPWLITIKRKI